MLGLILAAGSGSRLGEGFGKEVCKPLVKIAGKHLIEYSLENLFSMKVERIYIVVGEYKKSIEEKIGSSYNGVPVYYVTQKRPVGLVNAIACALPELDNDTVLQLSDEIFVKSAAETIGEIWKEGTADIICGVTRESDPEKIRGNYSVDITEGGELIACTEKPKIVKNDLKGTGFCIFGKDCIDFLRGKYDEESNTPKDLCDYINLLLKDGKHGRIAEISAKEFNINTAEDAAAANAELGSSADGGVEYE